MKKKKALKKSTQRMVLISIFCAIICVMQLTGVGLITIGLFSLTTLHIPVILGAILLGPRAGAIFGATFGIMSIWSNTLAGMAKPTAYIFSPFLNDTVSGALSALWTALGCRILLGVFAGWLWIMLKKIYRKSKKDGQKHYFPDILALPVTAAVSTFFHTLLVMSSMFLLFPESSTVDNLFVFIASSVTLNAVFEMITALILVSVLATALSKYTKKIKE